LFQESIWLLLVYLQFLALTLIRAQSSDPYLLLRLKVLLWRLILPGTAAFRGIFSSRSWRRSTL